MIIIKLIMIIIKNRDSPVLESANTWWLHSWSETPDGLDRRKSVSWVLMFGNKCHRAPRCRYKMSRRYSRWVDETTISRCTVPPRYPRPSAMVPRWRCSLSGRDILPVFSSSVRCPYRNRCHRPMSEPVGTPADIRSFRPPCVRCPRRCRLILRPRCSDLLPSCFRRHCNLNDR